MTEQVRMHVQRQLASAVRISPVRMYCLTIRCTALWLR